MRRHIDDAQLTQGLPGRTRLLAVAPKPFSQAHALASGVYFVRLQADNGTSHLRVVTAK